MCFLMSVTFLSAMVGAGQAFASAEPPLIRSAESGRWSDAATWQAGKVPGSGARVQVKAGHVVTFDIKTDGAIRSIHVAGTLRFDPGRDTRLDVGLIKIQPGDDSGESGFDCENHVIAPDQRPHRAALEVGMPDQPIARDHSAVIRLTAVAGLDPEECPAIVCCGGRWDVHGSPLRRTWVKLAAPAAAGGTTLALGEPVTDWRVGDRVIITATGRQIVRNEAKLVSVRQRPQTEERTIRAIKKDGLEVVLDAPLAFAHSCFENRRGDVANLSRNVIIESATPEGVRGHTMYHRHSAGSISYAEFRHLGKQGKLGKYSLHFHRAGDTMRGTSVIGASIWDSANRWITIHGTNTLVVRDCVGYQSTGHGFFLEDGTEVENILDRNLAVQACQGKPLPGQVFPHDGNEGAGFWWADSRNAFIRNVAVECDGYGYRFDAPEGSGADLSVSVKDPDGQRRKVDIRTLPFIRFDGNEAHDHPRYGLNLGGGAGNGSEGGVGEVGPDGHHPFMIRNFNVWDTRWGVTLAAPSVLIDGLTLAECDYGFWRSRYAGHAYRGVVRFRVQFPEAFMVGQRPDEIVYPSPLKPVDDRPPVTVMIRVSPIRRGRLVVQGVTVDDGMVRSVRVNGHAARPLAPNYLEWQVEIDAGSPLGPLALSAQSEDAAGNLEPIPHRATIEMP
ncbi:MAG: G8 domain-containing protein [Isosphaerales bacterium]